MSTVDNLDTFFERDNRIRKSGVREVFTPHTPIASANALQGRNKELESLLEHLSTPGQHALLYGERGIGKSSLAEVAVKALCDRNGVRLYKKQCSKSDSFASIFEKPLKAVGIDIYNTSKSKSNKAGIDTGFIGMSNHDQVFTQGDNLLALNPSFVAEAIADIKGILLVDEFDAILDKEVKYKIAEVIKLLSDRRSSFKILIVGIAYSSRELTAGHPSISRCVKEIKVEAMKVQYLIGIIRLGAEKLNIKFAPLVQSKIALVSSGYPYFTHLLALKSAENVIAEERSEVTFHDLNYATTKAIEDSEESLKTIYEETMSSSNREMYERILLSAAACKDERFTNSDICSKYYNIFREQITAKTMAVYLGKLSKAEGSRIISRLSRGTYKFTDPPNA